jgi:hypothetical protein
MPGADGIASPSNGALNMADERTGLEPLAAGIQNRQASIQAQVVAWI